MAAAAALTNTARFSGRYAVHPLLPGAAQLAVNACTGRLVPAWRPKAEHLLETWNKLEVCMPKYKEFLSKVNRKDIKKIHVFMNDDAQVRLGEFYLCCALRLRPDAVEKVSQDNPGLLALANTVATEDVEPFFEQCREFVADYDADLHQRLDETTIWREVDDALFWHHSFLAAAPEAYTAYRNTVLPPEADWPKLTDGDVKAEKDVEALLESCAEAVSEGGKARGMAEEIYQRFLEASKSPAQAGFRAALIDHGIIWGEVVYRGQEAERVE